MVLTEQHIIRDDRFRAWCEKSKNLYNQSLYYWRQSVFGNIQYFSEYELLGLYREFKEENFSKLPSHCGQEIIKNLFKNIKAWQASRKEYHKNPSNFLGKPKMPKYKKELSALFFNYCQVKLKNGFVHFPKMIGVDPIKTNIPNIKYCRIIPKSNHFVVEFIYTKKDVDILDYNGNAIGIDLGLNNMATVVSNNGHAFIIKGTPLKSINQLYNKRLRSLKSELPLLPKKFKSKNGCRVQVGKSKAISKITFNRNNQIKNYIHHASKLIIAKAKELDVTKIVIGNNKNWKQEINIGKRNNQNFVSIPHSNLIKSIEYKAKVAGIEVITIEESYTSKCSFVDLEPIERREIYVGKRIKRGLFLTKNGVKINADCGGAGNILRKVIGDFEINDSIVSAVIAPKKFLINN